MILGGLAALLLMGCGAVASEAGQDAPQVEPALALTGRVVDAADIFSPEFETALTARLAQLERETKVQMVVVTTPDLEGRSIEDYSLDLANAWAIGDGERNDGLLILVAPEEERVRIEVGLGLEDTITNAEAKTIIFREMIPLFSEDEFETGVDRAVDSLISEVASPELKEAA